MSISIKTLTITLAGLALSAASLPTIQASAQTTQPYYPDNYVVVNVKQGLNYRDRNCNVIKTLPMDTVVSTASGWEQINCNIKGQNLTLTKADETFGEGVGGFIYLKATSIIRGNGPAAGEPGLQGPRVVATSGLNVRDSNCKKTTAVPNNFKFEDHSAGFGGSMHLCKVRGEYYNMTPVILNGKVYQVASAFVTYK